ncbi:MAG: branched-chain amino acid ABC transporter permease [Rhodospirillaceae bacterium]|nr:branched-chain amino acid ABC transporter permease [Rhodospirillaceae bacterium]
MRAIDPPTADAPLRASSRRGLDLFSGWRHGLGIAALIAVVAAAPLVLSAFWLGEIGYVFILAIAAVGLMLLSGYTGLVSLSHAAFIGIGAYANAHLLKLGVPFALSLPAAGALAGVAGLLLGLPMLRLSGLYLAIGTYAFGLIVEQVFIHWEAVTNGFRGLPVPRPTVLGFDMAEGTPFYLLCLALLVGAMLGALNLLRSPTGRAFVAIRDSAVAAQALGIDVAFNKTVAFGLSAAFAGIAGALLSHKIGFLAPDIFGIHYSIQLLVLIVVGGLGSMAGVIYGAIFVAALPQAISFARDALPPQIAQLPGLESGLFGLVLVLCILFEPLGIHGRWLKIKARWRTPKSARVGRAQQKAFARSERMG